MSRICLHIHPPYQDVGALHYCRTIFLRSYAMWCMKCGSKVLCLVGLIWHLSSQDRIHDEFTHRATVGIASLVIRIQRQALCRNQDPLLREICMCMREGGVHLETLCKTRWNWTRVCDHQHELMLTISNLYQCTCTCNIPRGMMRQLHTFWNWLVQVAAESERMHRNCRETTLKRQHK